VSSRGRPGAQARRGVVGTGAQSGTSLVQAAHEVGLGCRAGPNPPQRWLPSGCARGPQGYPGPARVAKAAVWRYECRASVLACVGLSELAVASVSG
jgi:hypothetical protein